MNKNTFLRSALSLIALLSILTPLSSVAYAQTSAASAAQTAPDLTAQLASIEEKVEKRRQELGIPGMSLVIVKDDQIIFMKGLGYKNFEKKLAVTPDTQFAIGSSTKAFTALTALMSVDEGKLLLDDSPKKYLSYFKINDPDIDAKIAVRDLMSHSSGLNRTDLAMITGKLTREELIRVAGEAKPVAKLREKFMYQNLMFTAAGEIVSVVQKKPYEQVIRERILAPLGMTNTTLAMREMEKTKDFSYGYSYDPESKETTNLPFRDIDSVAPAGSINSSARDMVQWLRFVLNGGTLNGKRLVSEKSFDEWLKPQMKIGPTSSYGLGWFLQQWNGFKVVQHGGNIDGFNAMVAMVPEKKLGFVMLTNVSGSSLGAELMPIVWGGILGEPDGPKNTVANTIQREAGTYNLKEAGVDMVVKFAEGKLTAEVPGQPAYTLENVSDRKYKLAGAPEGFFITFKDDSLYLEQPHGNYTLPKAGAKPATSTGPNPAKELIGRYDPVTGKVAIEVKEQEGKILLIIPGRPVPLELKEKEKDVYSVPPLSEDFSVRVKRTSEGKLDGIEMLQPGGASVFKFAGIPEVPKISADELMAKIILAAGGEANMRKINSRVVTFESSLENEGLRQYGTSYSKAPNKTATDTTLTALGKKIASSYEYFDGTGGQEEYSFAPRVETYSGRRLDDVKRDADFYSLLDWKNFFKKVEVASLAKVGGEECYVVNFEPQSGSKYTEYYSTNTFLLLKREGAGGGGPYSISFSDYRDVDGIKLAFRNVSYSASGESVSTTIKEIKQNVEINDEVFKLKKL